MIAVVAVAVVRVSAAGIAPASVAAAVTRVVLLGVGGRVGIALAAPARTEARARTEPSARAEASAEAAAEGTETGTETGTEAGAETAHAGPALAAAAGAERRRVRLVETEPPEACGGQRPAR